MLLRKRPFLRGAERLIQINAVARLPLKKWRMASDRTSIIQITGPFSGGSTMTRHLFFAISLIGTGALLNSPAEARQTSM